LYNSRAVVVVVVATSGVVVAVVVVAAAVVTVVEVAVAISSSSSSSSHSQTGMLRNVTECYENENNIIKMLIIITFIFIATYLLYHLR
jgi:hypothetical protein